MIKKILLFIAFLFLISCDGGLKPEPDATSYLKGTVRFVDDNENWISRDSIFDLRVVAFKNFPPQDILQEVLTGNAYFTLDSLPYYVNEATFSIEISDAPVTIEYVAVALQYGENISTDWLAVGVYTESGDKTQNSSVQLGKGETKEIVIDVDFNDLPPQPF